VKTACILDLEGGGFGLEYDNNVGRRNTMRLDAKTYEKAVHEARLFLEINQEDIDPDGTNWEVE
jgi:hypothetical protein